jgi:hypothetical protein
VNWVGHERKTALDVAERSGVASLVEFLRAQGGRFAADLS